MKAKENIVTIRFLFGGNELVRFGKARTIDIVTMSNRALVRRRKQITALDPIVDHRNIAPPAGLSAMFPA